MRISAVEPILFDAGLGRIWCLVRVDTFEGVRGYGEATTTEPYSVATLIRRLGAWLVGEDAGRVQDLWQRMHGRYHNVRGGNVLLPAISGIEHALWDIKGKAAGLPVYEMLGGAVRDRVPVYCNHMFFSVGGDPFFPQGDAADAPARYRDRALEAVSRGFGALKLAPFGSIRDSIDASGIRHLEAVVGAVRDAVGPEVEIAIDTHGRFQMPAAIRVAQALEQFRPWFVEELAPPENLEVMRRLRERVRVPLASGERAYGKWAFHTLLSSGAVEIVQVDVAHCGGILEARLIAGMAECHSVQLAPHAWYGPVAMAASLQLDATIPNLLVQEVPVPYLMPAAQNELVGDPFPVTDRHVSIPSGPGLGLTINEDVLMYYRIDG